MSISADGAVNAVLAAKQAATFSDIATAVAAKGLDAQRAQGDAALQLLQAATPTGRAPDKGQQFDAVQ